MTASTPTRGIKRKNEVQNQENRPGEVIRKRRKNDDSETIEDGFKNIPFQQVRNGFFNLKNTCYIGCALQVFAMDSDLLQLVMRIPSETSNPGSLNKILALQIALLHAVTGSKATKKSNKAAMEKFCQSFEVNPDLTGDAAEFLQTLIELIREHTKNTNLEQDFLRYFYSVDDKSDWKATMKFVDGGSKDVKQALSTEEGTKCDQGPGLQIVCINRLQYDREQEQMVRLNQNFNFPTELPSGLIYKGKNEVFKLKAVIAHQYKEKLPHYTVHVRSTSDNQTKDLLGDGAKLKSTKGKAEPTPLKVKAQIGKTPKDSDKAKPGIKNGAKSLKSKPKPSKQPQKKGRASRCKECANCLREECGVCKFCLDKPKNGGSNLLKKACIERQCIGLSVKQELTSTIMDYTITKKASTEKTGKTGTLDYDTVAATANPDSSQIWLNFDDIEVNEETESQVLQLAGNPNGSEEQALASVLIYASHNPSPASQIEVSVHILEAYDSLTCKQNASTSPGCILKMLDPCHIQQNTSWHLVNQASMTNLKFEVGVDELDLRVTEYLGSSMCIQPDHLHLYKRQEQNVMRSCIDANTTFRELIPAGLADGEGVPELKFVYISQDDINPTQDEMKQVNTDIAPSENNIREDNEDVKQNDDKTGDKQADYIKEGDYIKKENEIKDDDIWKENKIKEDDIRKENRIIEDDIGEENRIIEDDIREENQVKEDDFKQNKADNLVNKDDINKDSDLKPDNNKEIDKQETLIKSLNDETGQSFLVAVKLFDPVNERFLLNSLERVKLSMSVSQVLQNLNPYQINLNSNQTYTNNKTSFSVSMFNEEKLVSLTPDTLFHSVFQMAGNYIPVLLVERRDIKNINSNEPIEKKLTNEDNALKTEKTLTLKEYIDRELNSFYLSLQEGASVEQKIKICVKEETDQVYNLIGQLVNHPEHKIQLSCMDKSAVSYHVISDLKTTLEDMLCNKIPRILKVHKLDVPLKDLNNKITYTIQVLQMSSLFKNMSYTDVELKDTDPTVDQLIQAVTENMKENMTADSILHLVLIQKGRIVNILPAHDKVSAHVKLSSGKNLELAAIKLPASCEGQRVISCYTFKNKFFNIQGHPGLLLLPSTVKATRSEIEDFLHSQLECSGLELRERDSIPVQFDTSTVQQLSPELVKNEGIIFERIFAIKL